MFLQVSVCPHREGVRGFIPQGGMRGFILVGCAWFYSGGVCGFIQGGWWACVVLFRGHAWFYLGGMHGFIQGACMVLFGGCVVFLGGHAWFFQGGMCGFFSFFGYNEIRSMSGRYASYWNAFLFYSCTNKRWKRCSKNTDFFFQFKEK